MGYNSEASQAQAQRRNIMSFLQTYRLKRPGAPEFIKRLNSFEEAKAGSDVIFECSTKGFPQPTIKWYKDDEEISEDNKRYIITNEDNGVQILCIEKVKKKDEGAYKCKAENSEGVTSTTGYLSVTGDFSDKPLSAQPRPSKNPERTVSKPPHLRTLVEQKSLEEREAENIDGLVAVDPLRGLLEDVAKLPSSWPLYGVPANRSPLEQVSGLAGRTEQEDSGSETSVESQDYDRINYDLDNDLELRVRENTPEHELGVDSSPESGVFSMETCTAEEVVTSPTATSEEAREQEVNDHVTDKEEIKPAEENETDKVNNGTPAKIEDVQKAEEQPYVSKLDPALDEDLPYFMGVGFVYRFVNDARDVEGVEGCIPIEKVEEVLSKATDETCDQKADFTQDNSSLFLSESEDKTSSRNDKEESFNKVGVADECLIEPDLAQTVEVAPSLVVPIVSPSIKVQPGPELLPGDKVDFPWLFYFSFIVLLTFLSFVADICPEVFILIVAILSLVSFQCMHMLGMCT